MKKNKVVAISPVYFVIQILLKLSIGVLLAIITLMFLAIITNNAYLGTSMTVGLIVATILLIGEVLYWKNSGIYITEQGDHIVRKAGWFEKQDKLLNGVIISNQIQRGPIDQVIGTATINAGIFGNKGLVGIRYKDVEKYDNMMRQNTAKFTSVM